jgi:hypothetical protein
MSKFVKSIGVVALVAVVTVISLIALGAAQPAAATETQAVTSHGGRGLCGQAGLEAAAEALNMTTDELTTQLWAGESLADLADEAGVDLQEVQDAVTAACQEATRDAIEQAVTDGTITREHADWLLEGLDKGFWGGSARGFGFGGVGFRLRGFGGGHGPGRFPFNDTIQPTTTPGNDT